MITPQARRSVLRTVLAVSMVAALVNCGGSNDSSSDTRQRNSALEECNPTTTLANVEPTLPPDNPEAAGDPVMAPVALKSEPCAETTTTLYENASQKITCDVTWDATTTTVTACAEVQHINVAMFDESGQQVNNQGSDGQRLKVTVLNATVIRANIHMSGVEYDPTKPQATIDFNRAVSSTESFTYDTSPTPAVDPYTESASMLQFSWNAGKSVVEQTVELKEPLSPADSVVASIAARQHPSAQSPGSIQATVYLKKGQTLVSIKQLVITADSTTFSTTLINAHETETDLSGVDTITLLLEGRGGDTWAGNYGPQVTFAGVKVNSVEILSNTGFDSGTEPWVAEAGFQACSGDKGERPCVTSESPTTTQPQTTAEETTTTVEETTTTVEETTTSLEETTTTVEGESTGSRLAATVSVQEVPCEATFSAVSGTVTLCESFDRIVGAMFDNDGKFSESIEATGSSFTIPRNVISGGGARFVRIAVGQKLNGLDVATFRGEGILDTGEVTKDTAGTIYVSQAGKEAINSGGVPDYMGVELRNDGKFDIYDIEDNELAFVTLNGEVYAEYDRVSPPSSWDEGKPLAWRAYQTDGFGLPRLVASGVLALGGYSDVDFVNPNFELNAQRIELITGENQGRGPSAEGLSEDPCGAVDPYMITTPLTPSGTNMVTFTVATDCESTDSMLGLVVYDYDEDWVPVFSQFKSTRYTSRIVATTFLADGEYDVLWGDFDLVGVHEYVVNGGGSGATCHHPQLDVDTVAKKATLRNCNPGAHRMRVYADSLFWNPDSDEDFRLPIKNNVIDLSMVEWDGYFEVNLRIDDTDEPDFLTCLRACDTAIASDPGVSVTLDSSTFSTDGGVDAVATCAEPTMPEGFPNQSGPWGYTDFYVSAGEGSFTYENYVEHDQENFTDPVSSRFFLPRNGTVLAVTSCESWWNTEDGADYELTRMKGINTFEITAPMPNRPSNDRFEDAPAIEPGVGRVEFTNVSATNEQGEMGIEYTNSADAGQFHSVWFTYTPQESGRVSFRVTDYNFDLVMRITSRDNEGRTVLHDEAEVWVWDQFCCGPANIEWETVSFAARAGTTYYIQVTNEDFEASVGTAALLVNGGEGDTVRVQAGTEPFLSPADLVNPFPSTTTTTTVPASTTSVAPADTVAPGSPDTTVPTEVQSYQAAKEMGSTNDLVTVLAPAKDAPASIEARQDARTIEIPVADLYGTVSAASANVNTARSLLLQSPNGRPIRVRPTDKTVTVPVGTSTEELTVIATDVNGKTVTAPITVKKTAAPLVKVTGSSSDGSGLPVLPIGIAVAVLVLGAVGFQLRRRGAAVTTESQD